MVNIPVLQMKGSTVAQVDKTLVKHLDPSRQRQENRLIIEAVAWHLLGKKPKSIKTTDVSFFPHMAGIGAVSAYETEIKIQLDWEDFPFEPADFNTLAAYEACTDKAKAIWETLRPHLEGSFIVWIIAGHMSGYYDGPSEV